MARRETPPGGGDGRSWWWSKPVKMAMSTKSMRKLPHQSLSGTRIAPHVVTRTQTELINVEWGAVRVIVLKKEKSPK